MTFITMFLKIGRILFYIYETNETANKKEKGWIHSPWGITDEIRFPKKTRAAVIQSI